MMGVPFGLVLKIGRLYIFLKTAVNPKNRAGNSDNGVTRWKTTSVF
jgi:hypothetical protein